MASSPFWDDLGEWWQVTGLQLKWSVFSKHEHDKNTPPNFISQRKQAMLFDMVGGKRLGTYFEHRPMVSIQLTPKFAQPRPRVEGGAQPL